MKLLLCSEAFCTQEIIDKCVELVGKPAADIKVAVINEAYAVEKGSHNWVVDNLVSAYKSFGELYMVNLLALSSDEVKEKIEACDVIYVIGGHTDYLMSVFNKTGFSELLKRQSDTKVYVGSSAGSMVLGKRISTEAYQKIYNETEDFGTNSYLDFVDFAIKPHLNSPDFPNNSSDILQDIAKSYSGIIISMPDGSAYVADGLKEYFIGPEVLKITS